MIDRRPILAAMLVAVLLAACAELPTRQVVAPQGDAAAPTAGLLTERATALTAGLAPDESAHWLLADSERAFAARLALTDAASSTIDVQYFAWQSDATGSLLAARLLAAADRGVRVRVLLDDFLIISHPNPLIALDVHELIEVRVFNPWAARRVRIAMAIEFLRRAEALNHRMHNKAYVADGRFAIIGGRNVGDRYFGIHDRVVQNDLDVLLAGPAAAQIADGFESYWSSEHAYPVATLGKMPGAAQDLAAARIALAEALDEHSAALDAFPLDAGDPAVFLAGLPAARLSAETTIYADSPDVNDETRPRLYAEFKAWLTTAEREVLISSPYFIPDDEFVTIVAALTRRGVRVAIVTNSLASNNHMVAHTAYRRLRRDLLRAGVELYELRPDAAMTDTYAVDPDSIETIGLHTKAAIVDRRRTFVGSANIDPRSMVLNTEMAAFGDGVALAEALTGLVERDMRPDNAWRVTLHDDEWLEWTDENGTLRRQPALGFQQRVVEFFMNVLPLKDQS